MVLAVEWIPVDKVVCFGSELSRPARAKPFGDSGPSAKFSNRFPSVSLSPTRLGTLNRLATCKGKV